MTSKNEISQHPVINNLRKIMNDRGLTQAVMADYADTSPSQFSKILSGQLQLSLSHISNIARSMDMNEIDLFTYPDVYRKQTQKEIESSDPIEATLQIKLRNDKKDQILKLVFGNRNLEILNK